MTRRIEKTVFLSYRHEDAGWAQAIFSHLTSHGFDVFFDYHSIPSGDFEKIILENIKLRAHFLVLLGPSSLDRCQEPDDWLRREIENALTERRNIIPLMLENFDFDSESTIKALTGKIINLRKYNGLSIQNRYFTESMEKLRNQYLNISLDAVLHPVSDEANRYTRSRELVDSEISRVKRSRLAAREWLDRIKKIPAKEDEGKIRYYTEMIASGIDIPKAYYYRASARYDAGDLDGAIQDYDDAVWLESNNIKTGKNNQQAIPNKRGGYSDWLQEGEEAEAFIHSCAVAHSRRASDHYDQGAYDDAIKDYDQVIILEPGFPGAYFWRGATYQNKGDFDKAISDYTKAIDIDPDDFRAFYQRGAIQHTKGEFESALADFTKTILIRPEHAMSRTSLFGILRKLGRDAEAKEHEQIALVYIQKEDEYNRACFEAVRGKSDAALDLLEIWLATSPIDKEWALQGPDLENIRDNPRFKKLFSK